MSSTDPNLPMRFGVLLYPQFELLDVYGPLEALHGLCRLYEYDDMQCLMIAESASPVSSVSDPPNMPGRLFKQSTVVDKTFTDNVDLDVLIVPGGLGSGPLQPPDFQKEGPNVDAVVKYIADTYPKLKYLFTICTGSGLAARAGVLDGRHATTNKVSWHIQTSLGPKTHWVAKARWVESGNVWTTSGVSAGTDGMLAWISKVFGEDKAIGVANSMEYTWSSDPSNDPFAAMNKAEDVIPR